MIGLLWYFRNLKTKDSRRLFLVLSRYSSQTDLTDGHIYILTQNFTRTSTSFLVLFWSKYSIVNIRTPKLEQK